MYHFIETEAASLLLIAVCLLTSAFFSCAETAITSLGTMKAKHLIDSLGKSAAPLKLWIHHPGRVITTILVFNTAVNILASAVTTRLVFDYFTDSAVTISTLITTLMVLIFGEIIPKSFAKTYVQQTALFSMRIVLVVYYVISPMVMLLSNFAEFTIRRLSKGQKNLPLITEEEIEFMVSEGGKAGIIQDLKKEIIAGAFDIDETRVKEIMTPRTDLACLEATTALIDVLNMIIQTGHSRIPIYRESVDHIVGVVLAKDILQYVNLKNEKNLSAKDVMREVLFAPESQTIMGVFKDLKRTKNHLAVIIDEYGGTAGIVTMEDILEELVGDIQDEFDKEELEITTMEPGVYEMAGTLNIDEFFEFVDLDDTTNLERDSLDVDTLGGWITHLIGQLPARGQTVIVGPLRMEVMKVDHHRIERMKVVDQRRTLSSTALKDANLGMLSTSK